MTNETNMKPFLIILSFISVLAISFLSYNQGKAAHKNQFPMEYQIFIKGDSIQVYDYGFKVGSFHYGNSPLDKVFFTDNE